MVFFSCEGCNETLKKAQVENHIRRCGCPVSCVDCSQVFPGVSYQQHTSCISEAEKYEKSLYKGPKGGGKKKRDPQAEWMDLIGAAAAEVGSGSASSPVVRNNLQRMADLGNVPRNEKKFKNFLSNSLRIHRPAEQDELWQFLRKRLEAATAAAATADANDGGKGGAAAGKEEEKKGGKEQEPAAASESAERRGKKRAKEEGAGAAAGEHKTGAGGGGGKGEEEKEKQKQKKQKTAAAATEGGGEGFFAWEKTIKKMVKSSQSAGGKEEGGGGLALKRLQKQVVAAALAAGAGEKKKELKRLFKAKVGAVPGVVVRDDNTIVYDKKAAKEQA